MPAFTDPAYLAFLDTLRMMRWRLDALGARSVWGAAV